MTSEKTNIKTTEEQTDTEVESQQQSQNFLKYESLFNHKTPPLCPSSSISSRSFLDCASPSL